MEGVAHDLGRVNHAGLDLVLVGLELSPDGYALGVNVLLYAMSH